MDFDEFPDKVCVSSLKTELESCQNKLEQLEAFLKISHQQNQMQIK